jgi:ATP-binding cassette subfamily G (WHITE) protein 2 (SNQ2)
MSFEHTADDDPVLSDLPTREALAAHTSPAIRSTNLPSSSRNQPDEGHRTSCASRVDVDFFDPEGVRNLNRTLSKISTGRDTQSDSTVVDDILFPEGPFDLEKTLRTILKRRVSILVALVSYGLIVGLGRMKLIFCPENWVSCSTISGSSV